MFIALQLLTRLPIRLSAPPTPRAQGRSLLWYPAVGALLGLLLGALALALQKLALPHAVTAALLLGAWALLTGLLHLDGLGDCADAWLGSHGDRARALAILKDPHVGVAAVVVIALLLLLKFAALQALLVDGRIQALLIAPLLGRAAVLPLFATLAYVRDAGLGRAIAAQLPRRAAWAITFAAAAFASLLAHSLQPVIAAALLLCGVRALALRTLGGFTGDVAGALIELVEAAVLLTATLR